ncbi:LytS family sensor histidine kinase [Sphingobacterium corticibacterium]|uniref:Signal transduction histidine kinase internal region domain-containing protein n=1 Tax=Sphingobacterium corticibacterium TaxID=2484746 RepID=A0A4Q6XG43_9SPHI|nr:hypothetical protein [Sphingobacterium corticibacterium]RZF58860.1 hypothetical protein EWE74_16185 [Sphingobacterium corticibacterium]
MRNVYLLRPFPKAVHIVIWLFYFGWISYGNVSLHGPGHWKVLLLAVPLMLGIIYLNRYWLRKLVGRGKINKKTIIWMMVAILTVGIVLYLALYVWPTALIRLVLPEGAVKGVWLYFLDFTAFYWTFAWYGIGLGLLELAVNILKWESCTAAHRRLQISAYQRQAELKRWLSHFMGNIAQHMLQIISIRGKSIEAYLALSGRCVRLMSRTNMMVPLVEELQDLTRLAGLFEDKPILLDLSIETEDYQIVPMMLLGLFKNMCKHGEFGEGALPAVFTVVATVDKLWIYTRNQVAEHSAWLYKEGGTGLDQLERLLHLYYGEKATLHHETEGDLFKSTLSIEYSNEHKIR